MKIYLSGGITGIENYEDIFEKHEKHLKKQGHEVVNPVKLNHDHDKTWESYMKEDIKALLDCEAIAMIPGWAKSRGASIELYIAEKLCLDVLIFGVI